LNKTAASAALLVSLLLASCGPSGQSPRTPLSPSTSIRPAPPLVHPPSTKQSTLAPTVTLKPTVRVPETIPIAGYEKCRNFTQLTQPTTSVEFSGVVAYQSPALLGFSLLSGNTLKTLQLVPDGPSQMLGMGFSPDGKWLAYSESELEAGLEKGAAALDLELISSDGEHISKQIHINDSTDSSLNGYRVLAFTDQSYWVNNNLIYATTLIQGPQVGGGPGATAMFPVLIDPFEGTLQVDLLGNIRSRAKESPFAVAPDLTRVAYQSTSLALWDLERSTNVWQETSLSSPFRTLMAWSAYSQFVAVADVMDVPRENQFTVVLSRDGDFTQLSDPESPLFGQSAMAMAWSPDESSLAIVTTSEHAVDLFLFDPLAETLMGPCRLPVTAPRLASLVWAPDSQELIYSSTNSPMLLLDLRSGQTINLLKQGFASGWSGTFATGN
jgi:hypothetical protein